MFYMSLFYQKRYWTTFWWSQIITHMNKKILNIILESSQSKKFENLLRIRSLMSDLIYLSHQYSVIHNSVTHLSLVSNDSLISQSIFIINWISLYKMSSYHFNHQLLWSFPQYETKSHGPSFNCTLFHWIMIDDDLKYLLIVLLFYY